MRLVTVLFLLLTACSFFAKVHAAEDIVQTPSGAVRGLVFDTHRLFQAVPYATPPVGKLRWEHPQPVAPWHPKVLNGTAQAPGCPQKCWGDEPPHICPPKISEDCLYMNIWTPRAAETEKELVPVIIFLHGGNFHDGYTGGIEIGGGLLYDGSAFVENTGQIMVVINYRLGNWGFLHLGGNSTVRGNLGLMDQMVARDWVYDNIEAFGGDRNRITFMGQSAGAMSISAHLSRPENEGKFQAAIMHSNPFGEPYRNVKSAQKLAGVFGKHLNCTLNESATNWAEVEKCMRGKTMHELLDAQIETEMDLEASIDQLLQIVVVWSPTIGTEYLPLRPLESFQEGNVLDVPYMVGTTSNETVIFVYEILQEPLDADFMEIVFYVMLGNEEAYEGSKDAYPRPDPPLDDYRVFASGLFSDGLFLCPTRNATASMLFATAGKRKSPVFHWSYDHLLSWGDVAWGEQFIHCADWACHGADLPGWWLPRIKPSPEFGNYTPEELEMGATLHKMWANMAKYGNPNGNGPPGTSDTGVYWPPYDVLNQPTLIIETKDQGGFTVTKDLRGDYCNWWDLVAGYDIY